jgi:hypothetical protein
MVGISLRILEAGTAPNGSSVSVRECASLHASNHRCSEVRQTLLTDDLARKKTFWRQAFTCAGQWPSSCFEGL